MNDPMDLLSRRTSLDACSLLRYPAFERAAPHPYICPRMAFSSPPIGLGFILFVVAACGTHERTSSAAYPPPRAEFLVATQDSTFWISSNGKRMRARGAPLTLARYDGRFVELFLADDDRSFPDALLVGLRVYRRDLASGDSTVI